jgi:chromosome segregation ATPase
MGLISQVEKERDTYSQDANKANANLMQMVEEVKLKKNLITELKKENMEYEAKMKQQQNLYEAVRAERNLYSKNCIEAQDEVIELKRKFKIASHNISNLKDEIDRKNQALTNEHHTLGMVQREKQKLTRQVQDQEASLTQLNEQLGVQQTEHDMQSKIIKTISKDYEDLRKLYGEKQNERDILGTQLIRRNDELALLYEKIKILQSTLSKGEVQYSERLEDIRLLKFKIGDLTCELQIVKAQASQIEELKKEAFSLHQQLLDERLQVKALSEELENPLNYHRWRKLEGTDPDTWELLQKIQTLQKRLIKKTEEVVEKDVMISEKEKLYVELKNLLARQPGPEVAEQLSIYQQNLKEKTNQMKAMAAELNMYQAQVNEYKYEIERLTRELQDMKRKYYEQKRRE